MRTTASDTGLRRARLCEQVAEQPSADAAPAEPVPDLELAQLEAVCELSPLHPTDGLAVEDDDARFLDPGHATEVLEHGRLVPSIQRQ